MQNNGWSILISIPCINQLKYQKIFQKTKVKWNSFMMGAETVNIPYKLFPFLPTVYIRQKAPFLPFTRCFNIMMTIMILELVRFWSRCRHNTRWMVCHYLKCSSVAWHSTRIFTVTHLEIQKTIFTFILFIDLISYATVGGWQKVFSLKCFAKSNAFACMTTLMPLHLPVSLSVE